jgi:hypothetical protein
MLHEAYFNFALHAPFAPVPGPRVLPVPSLRVNSRRSRKHSFPFYAFSSLLNEMAVGSDRVAWFLWAGNDLPLTLQHLHRHTSRKIRKLKAISIKLTPIRLRYFCLVTA